jgi:hypothetical protein
MEVFIEMIILHPLAPFYPAGIEGLRVYQANQSSMPSPTTPSRTPDCLTQSSTAGARPGWQAKPVIHNTVDLTAKENEQK